MTLADPKPVKRKKARKGMSRRKKPYNPPVDEQGRTRREKVHNTPCMVCHKHKLEQESRTAEHHWIMGRFKGTRSPDEETLPVCEGHHQGFKDTSKIAIHKNPAKWEAEYGRDKDWLGYANDLIAEYNN